jgi:hypothetical protein
VRRRLSENDAPQQAASLNLIFDESSQEEDRREVNPPIEVEAIHESK